MAEKCLQHTRDLLATGFIPPGMDPKMAQKMKSQELPGKTGESLHWAPILEKHQAKRYANKVIFLNNQQNSSIARKFTMRCE